MVKTKTRGNGRGTIYKINGVGPWVMSWYGPDGKRKKRSTGTTDRVLAEQMLNGELVNVVRRKAGIIDAVGEQLAGAARRPLREHLDAWRQHLVDIGGTEKFADLYRLRAGRILAKFTTWADIKNPSTVQSEIAKLPLSPRTKFHHAVAVRAFGAWLVDDDRVSVNKLAKIVAIPVDEDAVTFERRAVSADEIDYMVDHVLADGRTHHGVAAEDRALAYRFAFATGIRRRSMASLTAADFDLDRGVFTVRGRYAKNRHTSTLPIPASVLPDIRRVLARKTPTATVFHMPVVEDTAEMLREDMTAARLHWLENGGDAGSDFLLAGDGKNQRRVDFHGLRVSAITRLLASGAPVTDVMALATHRSLEMTQSYNRENIDRLRVAVDQADTHDQNRRRGGGSSSGSSSNANRRDSAQHAATTASGRRGAKASYSNGKSRISAGN